MAGQLNEAINMFNTAMANRRKLAQDRQSSDLDRALKLAELQSKGFTVSEQQTPRKLLGFIPAGSQRSLSFNYDPSANPELQKRSLEMEKLKREVESYDQPLPEGFIRLPGGKVAQDRNFKRMQTPEERTAKLEDEIAKKELSSMTTNLPKLEQALQAAEQLQNIYYQGMTPQSVQRGDVKGAIKARLAGPKRSLGALIGTNPELQKYLTNRKAFAGLIAKGGFGEAGMLTNQDIARVVAALPNEYSTAEEAKMGFEEVQKLLGAARSRFEQKKNAYINKRNVTAQDEGIDDPLGVL